MLSVLDGRGDGHSTTVVVERTTLTMSSTISLTNVINIDNVIGIDNVNVTGALTLTNVINIDNVIGIDNVNATGALTNLLENRRDGAAFGPPPLSRRWAAANGRRSRSRNC